MFKLVISTVALCLGVALYVAGAGLVGAQDSSVGLDAEGEAGLQAQALDPPPPGEVREVPADAPSRSLPAVQDVKSMSIIDRSWVSETIDFTGSTVLFEAVSGDGGVADAIVRLATPLSGEFEVPYLAVVSGEEADLAVPAATQPVCRASDASINEREVVGETRSHRLSLTAVDVVLVRVDLHSECVLSVIPAPTAQSDTERGFFNAPGASTSFAPGFEAARSGAEEH